MKTWLANRRIDLIVGSVAIIQQPGSRVACQSRGAARSCAEEPAIIRARTKGIAILLSCRRVPGTGSAGSPSDDRHAGIVPVVNHDAAVCVDGAGRLSGEIIECRGIAGSG